MTIAFELTDEAETRIVEQVTALVLAKLDESRSPWLTRSEAANYLRLPVSRLEKDRTIPSHRDRGRVLYNRNELDAYFVSLGPCGT